MIFGSALQHQIKGYHGTAPAGTGADHAQNCYNIECGITTIVIHRYRCCRPAANSEYQWDSSKKSESISAENGKEDRLK